MSGFSSENARVLAEADQTQQATKEALLRIKKQAAETEAIGSATLEELRAQGAQMDDINSEVNSINDKLDTAASLQDRFDRWAGNWFGGKKRAAAKEATEQSVNRNVESLRQVKEVFEHSEYTVLSRKWKSTGLFLCNSPDTPAPDLFDPSLQGSIADTRWSIDFSLTGIDAEGWTYAYDFGYLNKHGAGDSSAQRNSYVRRRKWKYTEATGKSDAVNEIQKRQNERNAALASTVRSSQAEKIGYVPRTRQSALTESSYTSTARKKGADDDLDEESRSGLNRIKQNDAEIDADIDDITNTIDSLGNMAGVMRDETKKQNQKLDDLTANMDKAADKQALVNARLKRQVKSS